MAKKRPRKNPQDATLRNVRAAHKRLNAQILSLTLAIGAIKVRLTALERRDRA